LSNRRKNANDDFENIFKKTQNLYGKLVVVPRKAARQTLRANYDSNDPYVPRLDGLMQELNQRFNKNFKTAAKIKHLVFTIVASTQYANIKQTRTKKNQKVILAKGQ